MSTPLLNRRRLMMGSMSNVPPIECPYITNGLVFWLDGEFGIANEQWTDLIGMIKFNMVGNVYHSGKRMVFAGGYCNYQGHLPFDLSQGTFHICCKFPNAGSSQQNWVCRFSKIDLSQGTTPQPIPLLERTGRKLSFTSIEEPTVELPASWTAPEFTFTKVGISTTGDSGDLVVLNKSQNLTFSSTQQWTLGDSNQSDIGRRNYTQGATFQGEIMSILFYNRKLSLAEVLFNQQVDNTRFNLGL